jgi:nucleoside-diphosphate-sugar epimerase
MTSVDRTRRLRRLHPNVNYSVTIFGATGKTGSLIPEGALRRGWHVRTATRRRASAGEWFRFEWDDRERWPGAFRGVDSAYLLIRFNHPGAPETTPQLLEAAAPAGVRRIVLLSSLDAEHAEPDDPLVRAEAKPARGSALSEQSGRARMSVRRQPVVLTVRAAPGG